MKFERMEYVGVVVDDLEVGVKRFSDIFGIDFEIVSASELVVEATDGVMPDAKAAASDLRMAFDPSGFFELVQVSGAEEGFRNVHFRVDNMDEAIARLSANGVRLVRDFVVGGMREAIFAGEDLYGIRICLLQYEGSSIVSAMRSQP